MRSPAYRGDRERQRDVDDTEEQGDGEALGSGVHLEAVGTTEEVGGPEANDAPVGQHGTWRELAPRHAVLGVQCRPVERESEGRLQQQQRLHAAREPHEDGVVLQRALALDLAQEGLRPTAEAPQLVGMGRRRVPRRAPHVGTHDTLAHGGGQRDALER